MYSYNSYKNNGICQQISTCFVVLREYIYFCEKNDQNYRNVKSDRYTPTNSVTVKVVNTENDRNDMHDYDEFEIL
jgi:hypothetical protein